LPPAEIGTAHTENTVIDLNATYQQILEDLIFSMDLAGQDYDNAQAERWAWERLKVLVDQEFS